MADGDINGFDDRDAGRIADVVQFVEHDPRYRRKQRRWGGPAPATGGLADVHFRFAPDLADGTCAAAHGPAEIENIGCNATGATIGETIEVYDLYAEFSGETDATLRSRGGWAEYMSVIPDVDGCGWVVKKLDASGYTC